MIIKAKVELNRDKLIYARSAIQEGNHFISLLTEDGRYSTVQFGKTISDDKQASVILEIWIPDSISDSPSLGNNYSNFQVGSRFKIADPIRYYGKGEVLEQRPDNWSDEYRKYLAKIILGEIPRKID